MKKMMKLGLLTSMMALMGCQTIEAEFPKLATAAGVIVADLKAGDLPSQIEQDVARVLAGQPGVDVILAIQAVANGLLSVGDVPAELIAPLTALVAAEQMKQAAGMHLRVGIEYPAQH